MKPLNRERRDELRAQLLGGPQSFAATWTADRIAVAAPEVVEIADSPILGALTTGTDELICMTTEDAGDLRPGQASMVTPSEVGDWRWQFSPVDVVIAKADLSAAVLMTVDEFILVAGPREVVEKALEQTVEEARATFAIYAQDMATASRHLRGIANQYS